jgi:hypothetical protein
MQIGDLNHYTTGFLTGLELRLNGLVVFYHSEEMSTLI